MDMQNYRIDLNKIWYGYLLYKYYYQNFNTIKLHEQTIHNLQQQLRSLEQKEIRSKVLISNVSVQVSIKKYEHKFSSTHLKRNDSYIQTST